MGQKNITTDVWEKIHKEYVSSDISQRDLAKKYGVPRSTLQKKCTNGKWFEERKKLSAKMVQKSINNLSGKYAGMYSKACDVSNLILEKIQKNIEAFGDSPIPGAELKAYTGAIKDMREMGMFRAEMDRQEQEARIRKLQKECEEENKDNSVTVRIEGELKDYLG